MFYEGFYRQVGQLTQGIDYRVVDRAWALTRKQGFSRNNCSDACLAAFKENLDRFYVFYA